VAVGNLRLQLPTTASTLSPFAWWTSSNQPRLIGHAVPCRAPRHERTNGVFVLLPPLKKIINGDVLDILRGEARLRQQSCTAPITVTLSARGMSTGTRVVLCAMRIPTWPSLSVHWAHTQPAMPQIEGLKPAMDVVVGALASAEPGPAADQEAPPADLLHPCPSRCYLLLAAHSLPVPWSGGRLEATAPGPS